ncbi:MAG: hypothetical protein PHI31_05910 [Desulfuromonadaceae bacterium]|nr:hypothetical protein [Desulfuromonadaceae bacterium]
MEVILLLARRNRLFIVCLILITWWCSQRNQGWMFVVLAPAAAIYQIGKLGLFWKDGLQRKDRFAAFTVIAVSILSVAAFHTYHHKTARSAANRIVTDILTFRKNYGRYPADETELAVQNSPRKRPYRLIYKNFVGEPKLSYSGTFGLFRKWEYDFSTGAWNYESE